MLVRPQSSPILNAHFLLIDAPGDQGDEALMQAVGQLLGLNRFERDEVLCPTACRPVTIYRGRFRRAQITIGGELYLATPIDYRVHVQVHAGQAKHAEQIAARFLDQLHGAGYRAQLLS